MTKMLLLLSQDTRNRTGLLSPLSVDISGSDDALLRGAVLGTVG